MKLWIWLMYMLVAGVTCQSCFHAKLYSTHIVPVQAIGGAQSGEASVSGGLAPYPNGKGYALYAQGWCVPWKGLAVYGEHCWTDERREGSTGGAPFLSFKDLPTQQHKNMAVSRYTGGGIGWWQPLERGGIHILAGFTGGRHWFRYQTTTDDPELMGTERNDEMRVRIARPWIQAGYTALVQNDKYSWVKAGAAVRVFQERRIETITKSYLTGVPSTDVREQFGEGIQNTQVQVGLTASGGYLWFVFETGPQFLFTTNRNDAFKKPDFVWQYSVGILIDWNRKLALPVSP